MCLLNQMLKDLEQRHASSSEVKELHGEIHSVPDVAMPVQWGRIALVLLSVLLIGFAVWWSMRQQSLQPAIPMQAAAVAPPVVKPTVSVAAPPAESSPAPAVEVAVEPRLSGMETELHSTPLAASAAPKPERKAEPLVESVAATPVVAAPPKHAKPTADISIKSVTPQQLSENQYKQAVSQLQQGRVAEARDALMLALQQDPYNHNARQMLAGLLIESKHSGEAMAILQDGVHVAPEQSGFTMALARLQVEAGDSNAALQTLEQGTKYAGDDAEYHAFYAALLQRTGRHDEAVTQYLVALQADPANTNWLVGIGISLQEQGKTADAREAFERARMVDDMAPELAVFVDQRLTQLKGK